MHAVSERASDTIADTSEALRMAAGLMLSRGHVLHDLVGLVVRPAGADESAVVVVLRSGLSKRVTDDAAIMKELAEPCGLTLLRVLFFLGDDECVMTSLLVGAMSKGGTA